jgi:transposase-like protein
MPSGGHNKKYSEKFKMSAVKLAERVGARKASEMLTEETEHEITPKLIRQWARHQGIDISTPEDRKKVEKLLEHQQLSTSKRREMLKGKIMDRAHEILDSMNARHEQWMKGEGGELQLVELRRPPAGAMKDYALAFGILLDKFRLEEGESTSRHETVSGKARDEIDEELDKLASQLARKAMEQGQDGQPAPVPSE